MSVRATGRMGPWRGAASSTVALACGLRAGARVGGDSAAALVKGYVPRRPLDSALHWAVREGLPLFLAQAQEHGGVPDFVLRAVQRYIACGDLSAG